MVENRRVLADSGPVAAHVAAPVAAPVPDQAVELPLAVMHPPPLGVMMANPVELVDVQWPLMEEDYEILESRWEDGQVQLAIEKRPQENEQPMDDGQGMVKVPSPGDEQQMMSEQQGNLTEQQQHLVEAVQKSQGTDEQISPPMPVDQQLRQWKVQSQSHRLTWLRQEEQRLQEAQYQETEKRAAEQRAEEEDLAKERIRMKEEKQKAERDAAFLKEQKRAQALRDLLHKENNSSEKHQ
jgi:hypothetical protein